MVLDVADDDAPEFVEPALADDDAPEPVGSAREPDDPAELIWSGREREGPLESVESWRDGDVDAACSDDARSDRSRPGDADVPLVGSCTCPERLEGVCSDVSDLTDREEDAPERYSDSSA